MICKYCNTKKHEYDKTLSASMYKADVYITDSNITFWGNNQEIYQMPIKFCPVCGRDLTKPTERNTEQDYSSTIRENIKAEMKNEHISISSLSKDTGIAKSTIADFLRGKIESLSAGKIGVIAEALKIPIEDLYK